MTHFCSFFSMFLFVFIEKCVYDLLFISRRKHKKYNKKTTNLSKIILRHVVLWQNAFYIAEEAINYSKIYHRNANRSPILTQLTQKAYDLLMNFVKFSFKNAIIGFYRSFYCFFVNRSFHSHNTLFFSLLLLYFYLYIVTVLKKKKKEN